MKASDFTAKAIDIAKNYKTLYVMGCFGAPLNAANKARYKTNHDYNKAVARQKMIDAATADTFGFDCVCLIKGILWGWSGNPNATYGGAAYTNNGVPDIGTEQMIAKCSGVSTNFSDISKIAVGEVVWLPGHIGIYVGNGLVVECTPAWANCVQFSSLGKIPGYNSRKWTKHGKLPYVEYGTSSSATVTAPVASASYPQIKKGTSGEVVKVLQTALNKFGYKLEVDGSFGPLTDTAVRNYQKSFGLEVDGIVGPKTWAKLEV